MRRRDLKLLVDLLLLGAFALAFTAGLVLFFGFHVGEGSLRSSGLGLARITWLDLHRLSALAAIALTALHVALDWKAFLARWRRLAGRGGGRRGLSEPLLHVTFAVVALAGLALWALVPGSAPLAGPVPLGPLPHGRHQIVDVHDVAGLVALALTVHHVAHRWSWIVRGLRSFGVVSSSTPWESARKP